MNNQDNNNNIVEELQPYNGKVNIEDLLNQIEQYISRHTILSKDARTAIALWCVATYVIDDFSIFPNLLITSPEMRCGKSTLLELLQAICSRSYSSSNMTQATFFRLIDYHKPTLIIDEADTFVKTGSSEMVGTINSGHRKSTSIISRCIGDTFEPKGFSTWSPKVLASIGELQSTIMDRSIVIQIKRKKTTEIVKPIPIDMFDLCKKDREKLLKWSNDNSSLIRKTPFTPPDIGNDRAADNWSPLFTIASIAGTTWLKKCDDAYKMLNTKEELALSTILLSDIKLIMNNHTKISSADLVKELTKDKDKPWCEYKNGKPISPNGLANILKPYNIKPKAMRINGPTVRGYDVNQFTDTFDRYL